MSKMITLRGFRRLKGIRSTESKAKGTISGYLALNIIIMMMIRIPPPPLFLSSASELGKEFSIFCGK